MTIDQTKANTLLLNLMDKLREVGFGTGNEIAGNEIAATEAVAAIAEVFQKVDSELAQVGYFPYFMFSDVLGGYWNSNGTWGALENASPFYAQPEEMSDSPLDGELIRADKAAELQARRQAECH